MGTLLYTQTVDHQNLIMRRIPVLAGKDITLFQSKIKNVCHKNIQ